MTCNGEEDGIALQYLKDDNSCVAVLARGKPKSAAFLDPGDHSYGFSATYGDGSYCASMGRPREIRFEFRCDSEIPFKTVGAYESDTCTYTFSIYTKSACKFSGPKRAISADDGDSSVWVSMFTLIVVLFVCANCIGFGWNLYRDERRDVKAAIPF